MNRSILVASTSARSRPSALHTPVYSTVDRASRKVVEHAVHLRRDQARLAREIHRGLDILAAAVVGDDTPQNLWHGFRQWIPATHTSTENTGKSSS